MKNPSSSMAVFLLLIASSITASSQQQIRDSTISLGSSLTPNENSSWLSPSGLFAFGFYKLLNGYAIGIFLAGIPEKTVVWTANRDDPVFPNNSVLQLTKRGRIILQQQGSADIDIINPSLALHPVASASMRDDGNFMLHDSSRRNILWQSFDYPTDTLLPGQVLPAGVEMFASTSETNPATGIFRLSMQQDGNLVQYPVGTSNTALHAYYASQTDGKGDKVSLNLDNNGNLYLFNGSSVIKNITTRGTYRPRTIYLMRIDADGILRVYYHSLDPDRPGNWTKVWPETEDKCNPKGLCGVNGYCTQMNGVADCECLPGFNPIDPGTWSSGCQRNFATGCNSKNVMNYTISALYNSMWLWEDNYYEVLKEKVTQRDCERACSEDCNCDGALFQDGDCRKQGLPLRYARKLMKNSSSVALVKVSANTAPPPSGIPGDAGEEIMRMLHFECWE